MRGAERRGDGADLDPQGRSNASIVKIGVVAKKHGKALALGQHRDPAADPNSSGSCPFREGVRRPVKGSGCGSRRCARAVLMTIRQTRGLQRPLIAKGSERSECLRECLLDGFDASCGGAGDCSRNTNECPVAAQVKSLQIAADCCPPSRHAPYDDARDPFV